MIYKLKNNFNLRYLKKNDLNENYHSWFQNQITTEYSSHGKFSKSKKYYADQMIKLIDSKNNLTLAICKKNKHLGNVSLSSFSNLNRSAEFSIIIGDSRYREKGLGFLVAKTVLKHGFEKLNLHRIYCGTSSNNKQMIKLAKKISMRLEGRKKKALFLNNKYVDQLDFAILKSEFNK
jgi:RimJ/RimL family protein N-acetyltransferase